MPLVRHIPTWVLLATSACATTHAPSGPTESPAICAPAREPNPPLEVVPLAESDLPRGTGAPEAPEPPKSFEPAPMPRHLRETVVSGSRRGCSVSATLDPEVLVVYAMIDVYALICEDLDLRPPLPERAERPPCTDGFCLPDTPHAVLIEDGGSSPIDGRAIGFVVPIADGFWVLPLGQAYREGHCMPDVEAETVEDGHARLTILHQEYHEVYCDEVEEGEWCGTACSYGEASQYDLFYDAKSQRALLVTRHYDGLDEDDEPTPAIEVALEADGVHVEGCEVDRAILWPPQ